MLILVFAAYIVIVVTASGTLRQPSDKQSIAWGLALLSTFGLPWSGIPLSYYLGAGSWTWFLFACISLCVLRNDGKEIYQFRRCFAIMNIVAIMTAICIFMYENGIPGDIPSIEGVGALYSLGGLINKKLMLAYLCFLISAIASFLSIYSHSERASIMLSFSYSSFLAIAFLPPARMLFHGIMPRTAIIIDTGAYFLLALLIHIFIMGSFSESLTFVRRYYLYVVSNAALTIAGIFFLFVST